MKKNIFLFCVLSCVLVSAASAREACDFEAIKKAVAAAQDEASLAREIESAERCYNRTDLYISFLRSIERTDAMSKALFSYTIGRVRLKQLKSLEESQQWEEDFNQGAALRTEALNNITEALKIAAQGSLVKVDATLLLWQYHMDQQDGDHAEDMRALIAAATDYAATAKDPAPLKKAADLVSSYGDKGKSRELYALYFRKFSSVEMPDEQLFSTAAAFLAEGNIELAESGFDLYLERIHGYAKEQAVPALLQIGRALAYQDKRANDPAYAERMFAAAEAAAGDEFFDEDTLYLRAFNLENGHELAKACAVYVNLAERYAEGKYRAEAVFKAGVISAYVLRDLAAARGYFEQLAAREPVDTYAAAALYQLGLFKQWEQDNFGARELYTKLVEKAGDGNSEVKAAAQKRLEEIAGSKAIEFSLQVFLDHSLGADGSQLSMEKAQIVAPACAAKDEEVTVSSEVSAEPSGCTQVTLTLYWSGNVGSTALENGQSQPGFTTSYKESGIKVLNLLVMSPSGAVDRAIKMINVR